MEHQEREAMIRSQAPAAQSRPAEQRDEARSFKPVALPALAAAVQIKAAKPARRQTRVEDLPPLLRGETAFS
jgi:hypothetical protein